MNRKIIIAIISLTMIFCMVLMTSCGGSSSEAEETTATQQEATDETVHAADPMTEEEMENDDSEGCIEDSEDLLY